MRILIDGGCWCNGRGYGRFTRELLAALARAPRHEYVVLLEEQAREDYRLSLPAIFVSSSKPTAEAATASSRRSLRDALSWSAAARRAKADAVFFPSVYSYFPLIPSVPALVGIHDTMADRFPQFAFDSRSAQRAWYWKVRLALSQCRDVLTVSQYSKHSIAEWWGVSAERLHVVGEGCSEAFQPLEVPKRDIVLCVGGVSPNKNLESLVRAFANVRNGVELVIAGDFSSDGFKSSYQETAELAKRLPVRFLGRVTDEQLCRLYNEARLLAFPSVEEGFGLPALEAISCGLPVVAHKGHAVEEVLGEAGVLVDARDEVALAGAINQVLDDGDLQQDLRRLGLERAAQYSWDDSARQLQEIFDRIWQ